MIKRLFISVILIILTLALFPGVTLAQGPGSSEGVQVQFGSNLTLEDGDTVEGSVVVFGGNFTMKEGSEVEGDVVVFGGNITIDGEVEGDVTTMGGNVRIQANAVIEGDVASIGGNVIVSPEAEVSGVVADGLQVNIGEEGITVPAAPEIPEVQPTPQAPERPERPEAPEVPERPDRPERPSPPVEWHEEWGRPSFVTRVGNFIGDGVVNIFWAFIVAGLSVLLLLFFPANLQEIQNTLNRATPVSFIVGLMTLLAAGAVIILLGLFFWLLLPICGIVFVALALALGVLGGWAVIGKYLGLRIFEAVNTPARSEISTTFLGVTVLTLVATMPFLDHLPLIGWMFTLVGVGVMILVGSTGLGAVVLSRFGTQPYVPASAATAPAAEVSEAEEDG
jgi:hypothetical protein